VTLGYDTCAQAVFHNSHYKDTILERLMILIISFVLNLLEYECAKNYQNRT